MIITERSNSIVVRMENDEDFMTCLNEAIHTYHIKQAWIRGFGFGSMIEYGVIEKLEPIFFKKNRIEKLVTIASLTAIVGDENVINFSGMCTDGDSHIGRLFNLTVAREFEIIIEILLTE
jgi:predicted DNA-binding protein with PD1-like motif